MKKLINTNEAAKILDVTTQTVRNLAKQRKITSYKRGHYSKFDEEEIKLFKGNMSSIVEREHVQTCYEEQLREYRLQCAKTIDAIKYQSDFYQFLLSKSDSFEKAFRNTFKVFGYHLLNDKNMDVVCDVIFNGKSLEDISEKYGMSRERARQIFEKSLRVIYSDNEYVAIEQYRIENERLKKENLNLKMKLSDRDFEKSDIDMARLLKTKVADLDVTVRLMNCVRDNGSETLYDLVQYSRSDLLNYRNFGKKTLTKLSDLFDRLGLGFSMDVSKYKDIYDSYGDDL